MLKKKTFAAVALGLQDVRRGKASECGIVNKVRMGGVDEEDAFIYFIAL